MGMDAKIALPIMKAVMASYCLVVNKLVILSNIFFIFIPGKLLIDDFNLHTKIMAQSASILHAIYFMRFYPLLIIFFIFITKEQICVFVLCVVSNSIVRGIMPLNI